MASPSEMNEAIKKILPQVGVDKLKAEQKQILNCIIRRQDCMAVLPTGFGKSLPFLMSIPVQRELSRSDKTEIGKIVVCCPLVSLMKDQVERARKIPNLNAAYIGSTSDVCNQLKSLDIIYASPETLVGDPVCREALENLNVTTVIIDEFHAIATWGEDSDGKPAFRKWFSYIGELRSICPAASVVALSATCTLKIRKRVMKVLNLTSDTIEISVSPNKPNIKIAAMKVSTELEIAMCWLVDGLSEQKEQFPKTIIYCNSIIDVSKIYKYISSELPKCMEFIDMYHSESTQTTKDKIMFELKNPETRLRITIATSALGMGVDILDCQNIILFGPPKTTVDLIQEMGRAGRDGKQSLAFILYNSYNSRTVNSDVKQILSTVQCRRKTLLQSFLKPEQMDELNGQIIHTCCDICASKCTCGSCESLPLEQMFSDTSNVQDTIESESDSDTELYDLDEYEAESHRLPDLNVTNK